MRFPHHATASILLVCVTASGGCSTGQDAVEDEPIAGNASAAGPIAPAATAVAYASLKSDAAKGEKVFIQCKTCHTVEAGQNRVGPSLHGLIGRASGQVPGYNYSPANKSMGIVWSEEQLYTYLEAPQKTVPGTKMAYAGLKQPQDRADVIAFLKTKK